VNDDPNSVADRLRSMVRDPDAVGTHSDECWQWHDDCALLLAADRLTAADNEIESLNAEIEHVWIANAEKLLAERVEARARLSALTERTTGDPTNWDLFLTDVWMAQTGLGRDVLRHRPAP
jgi:capsid protein